MEIQVWLSYLKLGFEHILDLNGYDHILFVTILCAVYTISDWKKIVWLVTAFTFGHSLTLALAVLNIVSFNREIIETLIPVTIIITGIYQIIRTLWPVLKYEGLAISYALTSLFGLVHGLGFSTYFRAILGKESQIIQPLLFFNIGVELGQLIVVAISLMLGSLLILFLKVPQKIWTILLSGSCTLIAFFLLFK